jgi:hypothetical protein
MDKQDFDRAIGPVPPSTVDVDAVIARERRAAWARRTVYPWTATAAAVVALAVGAVVLVAPSAGPGGGSPAPDGALMTTTSSPSPPLTTTTAEPGCAPPSPASVSARTPTSESRQAPSSPPATVSETPEQAAARLSSVLKYSVRGHLAAGTQLLANPGARPYGPLDFYRVGAGTDGKDCPGQPGYLMAMANVNRNGRKGNILAVAQWFGDYGTPECPDPAVSPEQTGCQVHTGPHGEKIAAATLVMDGGSTGYRLNVAKPDGTGLVLAAENVSDTSKKGGPPQSPAPPLTIDQLIEIATDPAFTLYPAS